MPGHISMWTVYDHPEDFPTLFVARRIDVHSGGIVVMTADIITSTHLKYIRRDLREMGLVPIDRHEKDEPHIVEVWL